MVHGHLLKSSRVMALQVYGRTHIRPFFFYNIEQNVLFLILLSKTVSIFLLFLCLQSLFPGGSKAIEYVMLKWRRVLGRPSLGNLLLSLVL